MTNYREILRLRSLGFNKTQIAQSAGCSRTTVIQVLNIAEERSQGNSPAPFYFQATFCTTKNRFIEEAALVSIYLVCNKFNHFRLEEGVVSVDDTFYCPGYIFGQNSFRWLRNKLY